MDDLRRRFAALEATPAPDLWDEAQRRADRLLATAPSKPVVTPGPVMRARTGSRIEGRPARPTLAILVVVTLLVALLVGAVLVGTRRSDPRRLAVVPPAVSPSLAVADDASPSATEPSRAPSVRPTATPPRPTGATVLSLGVPMEDATTYTSAHFTPAFTVRGIPGWRLPSPPTGTLPLGPGVEGPSHAYFFGPGDLGANPYLVPTLALLVPSRVIPADGGSARAAPADIVAWLRSDASLDLGAPTAVKVAGFAGTMLEGTVATGAKLGDNPAGAINMICSADNTSCGWTDPNELGVAPGERFRFVVLDVRGETMVVLVGADAKTWKRDLPILDGFMNSIAFPDPAGG